MPLADNFERHGREHISASQISKFIASPAAWVETYLQNRHRAVGLRAYEGKIVEHALNLAFEDIAKWDDLSKMDLLEFEHDMKIEAENEFDKQMAVIDDLMGANTSDPRLALDVMYCEENRKTSLERICKKVEVGIPACLELFAGHGGKPETQVEVRWPVQLDRKSSISVLGYIDWLFPDGHIVDLKTTRNIPTNLSLSHGLQACVYMEALKAREMEFLFIGDRKREPVQSLMVNRADDKHSENCQLLHNSAVQLGRMLRLSQKTLVDFLPINPESYYFNSPVITGLERN